MLDATNEALEFVRGKRHSALDTDRKLVLSLAKELEIIGEAAGKVSIEVRSQYGAIPWQDISGMRNRLIHAYFDIDLDVVGTTVTKDLALLKPNSKQFSDQQRGLPSISSKILSENVFIA